jgi:CheY-like chemotaxis protein
MRRALDAVFGAVGGGSGQDERAATDRAAAQIELLAEIAHELSNPLTVILTSAGLLRDVDDTTVQRRAALIEDAVDRCVAILQRRRITLEGPGPEDRERTERAAAPGRARVMIVDDDPIVARAMASMLAADGHEADTASDSVMALSIVGMRRYDAIVTDVRMPRLDGPAFYRALGRLRPDLLPRVIFVGGDVLSPAARSFFETTGLRKLGKPIDPVEFRRAVREVLDTPRRSGDVA